VSTLRTRAAEWTEAGDGTLYSFTRQHRTAPGFDSPIVMGIVNLDAGPRLLAPVDADYEELTIGQSVRLEPRDYDQGYDRGDHAEDPFFAAVPEVNEG
jgi:Predicted nucleic-acid-binding protein containing a Zn-ribbon